MLHKISEFCDKIDSIKRDADKLRELKYGGSKVDVHIINSLIEQIQADCYIVSKDKSAYIKRDK